MKSTDTICGRLQSKDCLLLPVYRHTTKGHQTKPTAKLALASTACCCGSRSRTGRREEMAATGRGMKTNENVHATEQKCRPRSAVGARDPFDATSLRLMRIIREKIRIKRSETPEYKLLGARGNGSIHLSINDTSTRTMARTPRKGRGGGTASVAWRGPRDRSASLCHSGSIRHFWSSEKSCIAPI